MNTPTRAITGGMAQRQLAQMKAQATARHRLAVRKGRPDELELPGSNLAVSISYGCRQVRVRLMEGREWVAATDFQPGRPWRQRLNAILDSHFGTTSQPYTSEVGDTGVAA